MSSEDIGSGTRWSAEIAQELEVATVGIVCITPENQHNPWVMFEAGALSKTIKQTFICPYLIDMTVSELSGPLSQFQSSLADRDGTYKTIETLNTALNEKALNKDQLNEIFDVWWPRLEQRIQEIPKSIEDTEKRAIEDILEELVNNTREQLRREDIRLQRGTEIDKKVPRFLEIMEQMQHGYENSIPKLEEQLQEVINTSDVGRGQNSLAPLLQAMLQQDEEDINPSELMQAMLGQVKEFDEIGKDYTKKLLTPEIPIDEDTEDV